MVVVSYEWYKTTYGGGLDEDTFNRLASQAFLFADAMTEYRLSACWARLAESVRTAVMSAVCAYADQANIEESGGLDMVNERHELGTGEEVFHRRPLPRNRRPVGAR